MMKKKTTVYFDDFVLQEKVCEALKKKFDGYSYLEFEIGYSNFAGNCQLSVSSYKTTSKKAIESMFIFCVLHFAADCFRHA